jgi:hypothetical protein
MRGGQFLREEEIAFMETDIRVARWVVRQLHCLVKIMVLLCWIGSLIKEKWDKYVQ